MPTSTKTSSAKKTTTSKKPGAKPKAAPKRKAAAKPKRVPAARSHAAPSPAPAADRFEPRQARVVITRLRERWSPISGRERAVFDSLSTDPQRSVLGARTKARGVAGDAMRWASALDRQLRRYPALREHYHPKRFVYFLERIDVLLVALGNDRKARGAQDAARSGAGAAIKAARGARKKLAAALERYAGRRVDHVAALSAARDGGTDGETLGLSIEKLAELGERWIAAGPATLLEVSDLTPALVRKARDAADALAEAGADASDAGAAIARDSPEVNLVEGWVLEEMQRARADVELAREEDGRIQRLAPGPATRRIFSTHPRKKKDAKAEAGAPAAKKAAKADDGAPAATTSPRAAASEEAAPGQAPATTPAATTSADGVESPAAGQSDTAGGRAASSPQSGAESPA